jgi:MarR family transcriptional regulator for hemolysin
MNRTEPVLGFLLHDVARLLRKRFEQQARELGLTRSQWQVLARLTQNEGIQQGALADLLEIEPITLGRIIDRLEGLALIERRPHARDRRIWLLHLLPKAKPLLDQMWKIGAATRAEALRGIADKDREIFTKTLTTMKSNLLDVCAREADRKAKHG